MQAYEPIYRACYESFPKDPQAAGCHWKVAWGHYMRRQADAAEMLRAHLRMFPGSEYAAGALYFLGRLAEGAHDAAGARAYYDEIVREYPNYYYNVLARERLKEIAQRRAVAESDRVSARRSTFRSDRGRSISRRMRRRGRASNGRGCWPRRGSTIGR